MINYCIAKKLPSGNITVVSLSGVYTFRDELDIAENLLEKVRANTEDGAFEIFEIIPIKK